MMMMMMMKMKVFVLLSVFFFFTDSLHSGILGMQLKASTPPRGWNSYDSFCWTITEEEFLENALLVAQNLRAYGYEYAVVDYLWYRRKVNGAGISSPGFDVIDEWGRLIPDPYRWPSSGGGVGFKEVANRVHNLGLKFGFHIMRGISAQAVNANTPILDVATGKAYEESGRKWYAKDIGLKKMSCGWMSNCFMSVNTSLGAGRAFLRSLYHQYEYWDTDFVKHDCVFGEDFNLDEISFASQVFSEFDRPVVYSLSPGTKVTPNLAKYVSGLANMYRITGDDWDTWGDVSSHFDVARDFAAANMIGSDGLKGKSWPDLDMLPLGWLTDAGSNDGPYRNCRLNLDEQRTQMTLWSMVKSPLMFGGDMRNLDETTFNLITNPTLLEINSFSENNMEFPSITGEKYQKLRRLAGRSKHYEDIHGLEDHYLGLTSCKDVSAKGWSAKSSNDELEKVCWGESSRSEDQAPFCLYKKEQLLESDEKMTNSKNSHCKLHFLATERTEFCLGASSNQRLTSKEFRNGSFSPCRLHANQMWELNYNGTLKSSYSGLCATVNDVKDKVGGGSIRSWIATGMEGKIYLAFFNLNWERNIISTTISDIARAIPGGNIYNGSCTCTELWTGKNFGVITESISMVVQPHGSAVFTMHCN